MSEPILWPLLAVALYLWTALGLATIFRKAGRDPRLAWIPFVSVVVLMRMGGMSAPLALLGLVPVAGWGVLAVAYARVSRSFGYARAMAALAFVVLPVWASVLAWGSARWLGVAAPARARASVSALPADASAGSAVSSHAADGPATAGPATTFASFAPDLRASLPPIARSTFTPPGAVMDDDGAATSPGLTPSSRSILPTQSPWRPPAEPDEPAVPDAALQPYAPRAMRSTYEPCDSTFDTSAGVSAVRGAPTLGAPQSALAAVSAQHAGRSPATPSAYAEVFAPDFRDPLRRGTLRDDHPGDSEPGGAFDDGALDDGDSGDQDRAPDDSAPDDSAPDDSEQTVASRRRRAGWLLTPAAGHAVSLTHDVVIIGRSPVMDVEFPTAQLVVISDDTRTMSKTHARLHRQHDGWVIIDLDSTNGVVLLHEDGSELEAAPGVAMPAGERFLLGDAEMLLTGGMAT